MRSIQGETLVFVLFFLRLERSFTLLSIPSLVESSNVTTFIENVILLLLIPCRDYTRLPNTGIVLLPKCSRSIPTERLPNALPNTGVSAHSWLPVTLLVAGSPDAV